MGLFAIRGEGSLFKVSSYGVHPAGSEVGAHDLVEFELNAGFGEVLHVNGSLHFGVHD